MNTQHPSRAACPSRAPCEAGRVQVRCSFPCGPTWCGDSPPTSRRWPGRRILLSQEPYGRGWGVPSKPTPHSLAPDADWRSPRESRSRLRARDPGVSSLRLSVTDHADRIDDERASPNLMGICRSRSGRRPLTVMLATTPPQCAERRRGPARSNPRAVRESVRESLWGSAWGSFVSERVGIGRLATSAGVRTRSV